MDSRQLRYLLFGRLLLGANCKRLVRSRYYHRSWKRTAVEWCPDAALRLGVSEQGEPIGNARLDVIMMDNILLAVAFISRM